MIETRYQRVAREQRERQAARAQRMEQEHKKKRVRRHVHKYEEAVGQLAGPIRCRCGKAQPERQDGYEKLDDLGESPDR